MSSDLEFSNLDQLRISTKNKILQPVQDLFFLNTLLFSLKTKREIITYVHFVTIEENIHVLPFCFNEVLKR